MAPTHTHTHTYTHTYTYINICSPWLQSATTAAQLISKPSSRDGPQPGYRLEQLCAAAHTGRPRPHHALLQLFRRLMSAYCFPEVRSPCSTGFWFPKSLESWLRLSLVYCNTKDNPLQTSGFPIKLVLFSATDIRLTAGLCS
jgi:hypothetical protein